MILLIEAQNTSGNERQINKNNSMGSHNNNCGYLLDGHNTSVMKNDPLEKWIPKVPKKYDYIVAPLMIIGAIGGIIIVWIVIKT